MVASGDGADRSTDVLMAGGDSQIAVQVRELRSELQARGSTNNRLAQIGALRSKRVPQTIVFATTRKADRGVISLHGSRGQFCGETQFLFLCLESMRAVGLGEGSGAGDRAAGAAYDTSVGI